MRTKAFQKTVPFAFFSISLTITPHACAKYFLAKGSDKSKGGDDPLGAFDLTGTPS